MSNISLKQSPSYLLGLDNDLPHVTEPEKYTDHATSGIPVALALIDVHRKCLNDALFVTTEGRIETAMWPVGLTNNRIPMGLIEPEHLTQRLELLEAFPQLTALDHVLAFTSESRNKILLASPRHRSISPCLGFVTVLINSGPKINIQISDWIITETYNGSGILGLARRKYHIYQHDDRGYFRSIFSEGGYFFQVITDLQTLEKRYFYPYHPNFISPERMTELITTGGFIRKATEY